MGPFGLRPPNPGTSVVVVLVCLFVCYSVRSSDVICC